MIPIAAALAHPLLFTIVMVTDNNRIFVGASLHHLFPIQPIAKKLLGEAILAGPGMILINLQLNQFTMQTESETLLSGYSSKEKAAYLGALASLATADRHADEQELKHFRELASAAEISEDETKLIMEAADDTSGDYLLKSLDTLKSSDLRFSLVTDLIALAKVDENYTSAERANIEKVSRTLGVNRDQFSMLDQFVDKAADKTSEDISSPQFAQSVGMQNQLAGSGINLGALGSGLLRLLGPMILSGIGARALGGRRASTGGLGGMFGNNSTGMGRAGMGSLGGSLGSIISGMARGRGNQSIGGMLGRLLK